MPGVSFWVGFGFKVHEIERGLIEGLAQRRMRTTMTLEEDAIKDLHKIL